ncbi:MAG: lipid-A-disaccharide synthase [Verrucomicrobia bacterium]|nr:lipid-A-disaccharide synthase [Verrucomicrobiota bacterium]
MSRSVMVVAGEISGDMHLAAVVREMQKTDSDILFWGIGGDEMAAAGVEIIHDVKEMAVLGLSEVLRRYGFFRRVFKQMVALLEERKPDAVLLVDYPGFNLRLAKQAHKRGVKVLYYVCPQVWAWHRSRIGKMAEIIDRLMVIFPFEVDVFRDVDLKVDFVGHPLVDKANAVLASPEKSLPWRGSPRCALLPGSRRQEVERLLPVMCEAASSLKKEHANISFIVAAPSERVAGWIRETAPSSDIEVVVDQTREVLRQADAAMVASGTATIETALMCCPMVVVYKTAAFTYWMGRKLVQVPHIGMVNIVAGSEICPEFIQGDATAQSISREISPLLTDTPRRGTMLKELESVAEALGEGGAAANAAAVILSEIRQGRCHCG